MKKIVKIRCGNCHQYFLPKSAKNIFCNRKCFKQNYYRRIKEADLKRAKTFPIFKCPICLNFIELSFDPILFDNMWLDFRCPICVSFLSVNVFELVGIQEKNVT